MKAVWLARWLDIRLENGRPELDSAFPVDTLSRSSHTSHSNIGTPGPVIPVTQTLVLQVQSYQSLKHWYSRSSHTSHSNIGTPGPVIPVTQTLVLQVQSYQSLKNWHSNGYPASRPALLGQLWDWSARCQYTVTGEAGSSSSSFAFDVMVALTRSSLP